MRTVVVGTRPPEIDALIASRRAQGLDLFDEIWNGDYHMNPAPHSRYGRLDRQLARVLDPIAEAVGLVPVSAFNLGTSDNYRVPNSGYLEPSTRGDVFLPTAAVVIEIVSPGDETFEKLPHYAAFGVGEVIVADPDAKTVRVFRGMDEVSDSQRLGVSSAWLADHVTWPD